MGVRGILPQKCHFPHSEDYVYLLSRARIKKSAMLYGDLPYLNIFLHI
jgi:hypothetical protein